MKDAENQITRQSNGTKLIKIKYNTKCTSIPSRLKPPLPASIVFLSVCDQDDAVTAHFRHFRSLATIFDNITDLVQSRKARWPKKTTSGITQQVNTTNYFLTFFWWGHFYMELKKNRVMHRSVWNLGVFGRVIILSTVNNGTRLLPTSRAAPSSSAGTCAVDLSYQNIVKYLLCLEVWQVAVWRYLLSNSYVRVDSVCTTGVQH